MCLILLNALCLDGQGAAAKRSQLKTDVFSRQKTILDQQVCAQWTTSPQAIFVANGHGWAFPLTVESSWVKSKRSYFQHQLNVGRITPCFLEVETVHVLNCPEHPQITRNRSAKSSYHFHYDFLFVTWTGWMVLWFLRLKLSKPVVQTVQFELQSSLFSGANWKYDREVQPYAAVASRLWFHVTGLCTPRGRHWSNLLWFYIYWINLKICILTYWFIS